MSNVSAVSNVLHAFICYRRTDGQTAAEWLFENFDGQKVTKVGTDSPQTLSLYLDLNSPAVSNWVSVHRPALELARVMFVVCSPGAFAKQGNDDWVHRELEWWLKNRDSAPILIDTTGEGDRWVPTQIKKRWPHAQRVEVRTEYWNGIGLSEKQKEEKRTVQRLTEGIALGSAQVVHEELVSKRRMVRRLALLAILLALAVGLALMSFFVANNSRIQAESATRESKLRLANVLIESFERHIDDGDVYGAIPWCVEALDTEPDPSRATQHRIRLASAMRQSPDLVNVWWHDNSKVLLATSNHRSDLVATAAADGSTRVWDIQSGRCVAGPLHHNKKVTFCTFDVSDKYLVTTSADFTARIWNARDGTHVSPLLQHNGPVNSAAFSPRTADGNGEPILATCGDDKVVRIWDFKGKSVCEPLEHDAPVMKVAFSPDGKLLACATRKSIKVWLTDTWKEQYSQQLEIAGLGGRGNIYYVSLQVPDLSEIYQLSFSEDGKELFVGSDQINIIEAETGKHLVKPVKSGALNSVGIVSPDASMIALTQSESVFIENILTPAPAVRATRHTKSILHAAFRPDSQQVATASADGTVRLWSRFGDEQGPPLSHSSDVVFVSYTSDGQNLITIDADGLVRMWKLTQANPLVQPIGYSFSPTNNFNKYPIWTTESEKLLGEFAEQIGGNSVALSSGNTKLLVAFGHWGGGDGSVKIWNVDSRKIANDIKLPYPANHALFSPDDSKIAIGTGSTAAWGERGFALRICNSKGKKLHSIEHEQPVTRIAWSPNGKFVASASGSYDYGSTLAAAGPGGADLWEVSSGGQATPHLQHESAVTDLAFSPDGKLLATSADRIARIWNVETGELAIPPIQHKDLVWHVSFDSTGNKIVTVSGSKDPRQPDGGRDNGEARIWEVATGKPVTRRMRHDGLVHGALFSPDGNSLLTFSEDETARLWDTSSGRPLTVALPHHASVRVENGQFFNSNFLVKTHNYKSIYTWDLSPNQNPLEEIKLKAELLSARQIDETGGLVYLAAEQIRKKWNQLRNKGSK